MKSIKTKLILSICLSLFLMFILMILIVNRRTSEAFFHSTENLVREIIKARSDQLNQWIISRIEDLEVISDKRNLKFGIWDIMKEDIYNEFDKRKDTLEMLFYADLEGNFYTTGELVGSIGERDYFQKLITEDINSVVSDGLISLSTGEKIFVIAHIIKDDYNNKVGVLGSTVLLETISEIVSEIEIEFESYAWIVDGQGYFIAHPREDFLLHVNIWDLEDLIINGENVSIENNNEAIRFRDDENRINYIIFNEISKTPGWILGVSIRESSLLKSSNQLSFEILIIISIILIITIIIIILLSNNFIHPILFLKEKIDEFSSGNENVHFDLNRNDELKTISESLENLKDSTIKQKYEIINANEQIMSLNEELEAANEQLQANNQELEASYNQLNESTNKLEKIIELVSDRLFNEKLSEKQFFNFLLESALEIINEADYGSIALINENNEFNYIASYGHSLEELNKINFDNNNILSSKNIKYLRHENLDIDIRNNLEKHTLPIKVSMISSIWDEERLIGNLGLDIAKDNYMEFSRGSEKALKAISNIASSYITFRNYIEVKHNYLNDIVMSMVNMLETYDKYTKGHSMNVSRISIKIAEKLDLEKNDIEKLYWAGFLHDIGKMFIPESILNKPDRLTSAEYEIMKKHSEYAYEVLNRSENLKDVGNIVLHHHERYDGKGYPNNLKEKEIPLLSRIISVADAYDTIISKRPYKDVMSKEKAVHELKNNSGSQFDPEIVETFIEIIKNNDS